jgi:S1-C subfamily serine protease
MRRVQVPSATIVSGRHRPLDPDLADYILYPRPIGLPASGLLGVMLDLESEGAGVGVQGFAANSGAEAAGVREGDRIVRVGDEPIDGYADIRIALMDSRPGQKLPVEVIRRAAFLGSPQRLLLQVELH